MYYFGVKTRGKAKYVWFIFLLLNKKWTKKKGKDSLKRIFGGLKYWFYSTSFKGWRKHLRGMYIYSLLVAVQKSQDIGIFLFYIVFVYLWTLSLLYVWAADEKSLKIDERDALLIIMRIFKDASAKVKYSITYYKGGKILRFMGKI